MIKNLKKLKFSKIYLNNIEDDLIRLKYAIYI